MEYLSRINDCRKKGKKKPKLRKAGFCSKKCVGMRRIYLHVDWTEKNHFNWDVLLVFFLFESFICPAVIPHDLEIEFSESKKKNKKIHSSAPPLKKSHILNCFLFFCVSMQKNFLPGSKAEKEKRRCLGPVFFFFVSFFCFFLFTEARILWRTSIPGGEVSYSIHFESSPWRERTRSKDRQRTVFCFFFGGEGKGKVGY